MGRPGQALVVFLQTHFIDSISDFMVARVLSFAFIVVISALVYAYFRRTFRLDRLFTLGMVFCLFTCPAFQVCATYTVLSHFLLVALFLGLVAYLLFDYGWRKRQTACGRGAFAAYATASFLVLLAALYTYPVSCFFFLTLACSNVLFSDPEDWSGTVKRFVGDLAFCSLGMLVYLVAMKTFYLPFVDWLHPGIASLADASNSLHHKYWDISPWKDVTRRVSVLAEVVKMAFGQTLTAYAYEQPYYVPGLAVVLIGSVAAFVRALRSTVVGKISPTVRFAQMAVAVGAAFFLSIAPIVLSRGGHASFRTTVTPTAIVTVLIFFGVRNAFFKGERAWRKRAGYLAIVMLVALNGLLAQTTMFNTALSAARELRHVRLALTEANLGTVDEIRVIAPEPVYSTYFGFRPQYLELAQMATPYPSTGANLVRSVLSELMGPNAHLPSVRYVPAVAAGENDRRGHALLIDMNEIVTPRLEHAVIDENVFLKEFFSSSGDLNVRVAFETKGWGTLLLSQGPNGFWEERAPFPHWFAVEFGVNAHLVEYALEIGPFGRDSTSRAPRDWVLQGSDDRRAWVDLDVQAGVGGWDNGETRSFILKTPARHKYYRFLCQRSNSRDLLRLGKVKFRLE